MFAQTSQRGNRFTSVLPPCLKTLREWFAVESHIVDKLFDAGFTVKQYVVERSAVMRSFSGIQVAFNPDAVVEHNDLTMLALLD